MTKPLNYISPADFINTYIKVSTLDKGCAHFNLYPYQEKVIYKIDNNNNTIWVSSRQSGKSSIPAWYLLYRAIFTPASNIGIFSFKKQAAYDILQRIKDAYEIMIDVYGPLFPAVIKTTKDCLELNNGSKIIASHISECSIKGHTFSDVVFDEFAFVPYDTAENMILKIMPSLGKKSKLIIASTKNEGSVFNQLLEDAELGKNNFAVIKTNWDEVPGRYEAWKENIISMMGKDAFEAEFVV